MTSIALVGTRWSADDGGGATVEGDVLRAFLSAKSAHTFLVYPDSPFARETVAQTESSARATFVSALREPNVATRIVRKTTRLIRRQPAPLPFAELSEVLIAAGAQCGWMLGSTIVPLDMPYVATIWDLQHRVQPWFPEVSANGEWRERERLYSEYVRRSAAVVTGTETGAREVRDAYGPSAGAIQVIPFPTPGFALDAAARPLPPRPNGVPVRYLFYPAQFWSHKNHVSALRVLSALGDETSLVLVGADRGSKDHVMREAVALGVASRVHAMGFVDRETLIALYRHAEALLFPSLFGPDNLPPLEAMALGCPVIAARVNGAEEQLGDAALLVDGLDVAGYVAALRSLRDGSGLREALVQRGRARARQWTAAHYADAGLRLIDQRIAPVRALWR